MKWFPSHPLLRAAVILRQWLRGSELAFILLAVAVGAMAGLTTAAQSWLAHGMQGLIYGVAANRLSALGAIHHPWKLLALPLGGLALVALARLLARRPGPTSARPPIDVVEANALHGGRIPALDNLIIGVQTILSNGCGASVGLEATYAQMGGGMASLLGQWLRLRRADLRNLVGAGAGAAVGAAFGAPLTGAFYAFEIVIGAYSTGAVAPVIAAALAAALVLRGMHNEPYLIATTVSRAITIVDYGAYAVLGALCALMGIGVMRLVTLAERGFQAWPVLARWRPVAGGVLLAGLALLSPQTLSSGHGALHLDLLLAPPVSLLLFVMVLKIAASVISLASGFRGGLFFASLFLGSLLGQVFGQVFNLNPWGLVLSPIDAALVGMAGLSVSIVGGPMTLALLMLETTHDFALMGVVLTAALVSASITREVFGYSFSTWRLHVRGTDIRSPRDIGWMLTLTAGRMMRRDWTSVRGDMPIAQFRDTVPLGATSKAIVTDADGHYCGIVATAAAHAPHADPLAPVGSLAMLADATLMPAMGIKAVLASFDSAMADELAVVDAQGQVVGVVSERHARRRYLEEIEAAQRQMFGETSR